MTVASHERDPAKTGECLFPVVPKIIASTPPATTTSTRPATRPSPTNPRSRNEPEKPLDIPTSFNMRTATRSETCSVREPRVMEQVWCAICAVLERVRSFGPALF